MKIFDAEKIRILDQHTILREPLASVDLMERAAQKVTDWLTSNCRKEHFAVFSGNGNNGGDGLPSPANCINTVLKWMFFVTLTKIFRQTHLLI